ncbi:FG-GAP repeat domain-containing protein [Bacillaceae bacterium C204]|uniref:FG-GAP repeat domain-containing protein n=1 Tax=Neobacillus sp. 204 TaxID=3383351 RepID=UPI0039782E00
MVHLRKKKSFTFFLWSLIFTFILTATYFPGNSVQAASYPNDKGANMGASPKIGSDTLIGDLDGNGKDEIIYYDSATLKWMVESTENSPHIQQISYTPNFGNLNGKQYWVGNFTGYGRDAIFLNWNSRWYIGTWYGQLGSGNNISWKSISDTSWMGNLNDGRPFWIGDYNGDKKDDILFYSPTDRNWTMGTYKYDEDLMMYRLSWSTVGNTQTDYGYGQVYDGRPFWTGDFNGDKKDDILFYYPGNCNWHLGTFNGTKFTWITAGNTQTDYGYGQVYDGRPFWKGDFNGDGKDDILFYYPGNGNWHFGTFNGTKFTWNTAGNTNGFGQVYDGRPFWTGDFNGYGGDDILFHFPADRGDGSFWIGVFNGNQLSWTLTGYDYHGRQFGMTYYNNWRGDFNGDGSDDLLYDFDTIRDYHLLFTFNQNIKTSFGYYYQ